MNHLESHRYHVYVFYLIIYTEKRDRRCFTPIHCAAQSGNVEVVIALLAGGSESNSRGFAGTTPLHISVSTHF